MSYSPAPSPGMSVMIDPTAKVAWERLPRSLRDAVLSKLEAVQAVKAVNVPKTYAVKAEGVQVFFEYKENGNQGTVFSIVTDQEANVLRRS